MLSRILLVPWTNWFLLYPDSQSPAELLGTAFWLLLVCLVVCWIVSRMLFSFFMSDETAETAIGVEADSKISWGIAYAIMSVVVGLYTAVLAGFFGVRELGWAGLVLLLPHIGVTLLLLFFSFLASKSVHGRA